MVSQDCLPNVVVTAHGVRPVMSTSTIDGSDKVPGKSDVEDSMLEGAREIQPNSRLSCQIIVTENLDGLIVHIPKTQL